MARKATKAKSTEGTRKIGRSKGTTSRGNAAFAGMIAKERKRLEKTRAGILARRSKIDNELAELDGHLEAMSVFLTRKMGAGAKSGGKRAKRGSVRQTVLDLIKASSDGLTRGEIIQKLNAGEKAAQQSISNALSNMFRASNLKRAGKKYIAA